MRSTLFTLLFLSFLSAALPAQINWQSTHGPEGGFSSLESMYYNSQYAFYPDNHFLYRTADGTHWEKLPYKDPTKFAAGTGTLATLQVTWNYNNSMTVANPKFQVSHDNALTWVEGTLPAFQYLDLYYSSLAICSHGIYLPVSAQNKIYRTQDDGLTWDSIPTPGTCCDQGWYDRVWSFDDQLYFLRGKKVYHLVTSGTTWELVSPDFSPQEDVYCMFASGDNLVFGTDHGVWSSNDHGTTWLYKSIPSSSYNTSLVLVGNRLYKNIDKGFIYTDDFGQNWTTQANITTSIGALATAGGKLLLSGSGGVYYFDAGANGFKTDFAGLESGLINYMESENDTIWTISQNGIYTYNCTTKQWTHVAGLPVPSLHYTQIAANHTGKISILQGFPDSFYVSTDHGVSWNIRSTDHNWQAAKTYWLDDVLVVVGQQTAARSTDFGETWTYLDAPQFVTAFKGKYYGITYGYGNAGIVSTSDLGLTWQNAPTPPNEYAAGIYATGDKLFFQGDKSLYASTDGINWTYASAGLPTISYYGSLFQEVPVTVFRIWNKSGKYYYYEPSIGFFISTDTCKTWLPLQACLGSNMVSVDTSFYLGGNTGGLLQTGLPQQYGSLSAGQVFRDDNNNGVLDPGETVINQAWVTVQEPGAWFPYWFTTTNQAGHYIIGTTPGVTDTLRARYPSNYITNINPPLYLVNSSNSNRDFGIHFIPNVTDVSIYGGYSPRPRAGKPMFVYFDVTNAGTIPASGTIYVKLDPAFHFTSANPAPTSTFGTDSLAWNFTQLALLGQQFIQIEVDLDQNIAIGTAVRTYAHVRTDLPDSTPVNNNYLVRDTVVASHDPNVKRVEPASGLTSAEIAAGKELIYTIQFQNTGSAAASRVRITDLLDTALDVKTLRLVSSSHPVSRYQLLPGGLLEIVFDPITLPDSNTNEAASHGSVSFAIQRYKAHGSYFVVRNKAAIYFDFNNPVITNTVYTLLAPDVVAVKEPVPGKTSADELRIFPNPARQFFTVNTQGKLSGAGQIYLQNTAGQICYVQPVSDMSQAIEVRCSQLPDGFYTVRVVGKTGAQAGKVDIMTH
jgi:uncharacterized repeat protein (TIGR01451 family)